MRPGVNGGATRAATGRLPFRAIGAADGMAIVSHSRAISLPVLRKKDTRGDVTTNIFLAADLRL
jgi:hypothetical protein